MVVPGELMRIGADLATPEPVHAEAGLPAAVEIINRPEIGLVVGGIGDRAGHARRDQADRTRRQIGVTGGQFPILGDMALGAQFNAVHPFRAGQLLQAGIVRIADAGIGHHGVEGGRRSAPEARPSH